MSDSEDNDVTRLLIDLRRGDPAGPSKIMERVYDQLRGLARRFFQMQSAGHTLQPTALVHELFLRMADQSRLECRDRAHFFAICARAMREILADHARRRGAAKRGGGWQRVTLSGVTVRADDQVDVLDIDDALTRLAALNERQAYVAECRVFSGMRLDEVAQVLGVSRRTVSDDWAMARAWLSVQLSEGDAR